VKSTDEEFVRAWLSSDSNAEVAKKMNSNAQAVSVRAVSLRKLGVTLPKRRRCPRVAEDIAALNAIIEASTRGAK